ncbi:MAG: GEVED domain-containing protein, partial [Planctomycetota bacterium]
MKRVRSITTSACVLILLLGTVQIASGVQRPANDDCAGATAVSDVTDLQFNTATATFDGPGHYITTPNIWFCYTATCTGGATVSLAGSSFDTKLAVYDGCACYPGAGDLIKSNDDFHGQQSEVTFQVTSGKQYLIEIGGYNASSKGPGVMTISCSGQSCQPANDGCAKAEVIGNVVDQPFDTTCATVDGPGDCMSSPNIWYRYSAVGTGDVTVSLAGSLFDTKLAVYAGTGCYPQSGAMIECNDDFGNSLASQITFQGTAGEEYLIEVGGYNADEVGAGVITISSQGKPPVGSKDDCEFAQPIGDVDNVPFNTTDSSFDGPGLCMNSPNIWYCYTATCTGDVTVSLLGSSFDTMLAVYKGCDCYPTDGDLIECNDDAAGSYQSQITFVASAGKQYLIEVGGYGSETGQGVLSIDCEGPVVSTDAPDLGDAPDSTNNTPGENMPAHTSPRVIAYYPTVFNDGSGVGPYGPSHLNEPVVAFLGQQITAESEADEGPDEDGVNNINPTANLSRDGGDDSIDLPLSLPNCGLTSFDYEVTVVEPGTNLWVNVWFDFNRDGDWDDTVECPEGTAPEWAVQNQFLFNLPAGFHKIATPGFKSVHPAGAHDEIWMRITLSEQPWTGGSNPGERGNGGSGPQDKYQIGETEDYKFLPEVPGSSDCPLCEDLDGNGVIDMQDLIA